MVISADKLTTVVPEDTPMDEVSSLKTTLARTMEEIRNKTSKLTVHDLRRLLFRCAAILITLNQVGDFQASLIVVLRLGIV